MYSLLLALIYISFISLGLPDSLLGSVWPVMQPQLDVPLSYAGIVSMIIAGGTVCSSLLSDRSAYRIGTGKVTAISVGMTAVALFGFSASTHFFELCLWAIPYGLGAGGVDAALNNYVALHYKSRHMSWLHCFWGVGASIGPYIMGYSLSSGYGWENGYFVMLHTLSDRRYSRSDFAYADGIILCFPDDPSHVGNILEAAGDTPMVLIHGCPTQPHVPTVLVDIGKGSAEAASCLLKLGCRSFVSVGGDRESTMSRVKNEAIRQTLSGQNAVMQSLSVEQSHSGGIRAVELLEGQLSGVDAILCESDAIAAGVLSALHRIGLRVPEDISIAGYDSTRIASLTRPRLTTVAQDAERMGRQAALYLIDRIEHPRTAGSEVGMIPTQLVKGESVGKVKA